jgi:lysylphosphatidylglycerol synthetase-like protein (DUF2156 family)
VVFYQTRSAHLAIFRAPRLCVFKMGEEAMLFPQTFTLQGAVLANVRTSFRRAEREGIHIQWYEGIIPRASSALLQGKRTMIHIHPQTEEIPLWGDVSPLGQTIAELTRAYGHYSLAFFGLAPEQERFLASGGRGLVNYRLINHTAVVLGDPLCAPEIVEPVTRSFLAFCASSRWNVAFYQASAAFLAHAHALNLRALKMGEEALLLPQTFTLQGAALANVRNSCRRAEREGIEIQWYEGIPPEAVFQQLAGISRAWLKQKGGEQALERGFSVGTFADILMSARRADWIADTSRPCSDVRLVPSLVTAVALTRTGKACAFLTFTPLYGGVSENPGMPHGWGWALDLMRRDPDAPPGVMELLLMQAMERFRLAGASTVSLGLAALSDTRQEITPVKRRVAAVLAHRMALFENRQTLFAFKQKFHPVWESRYVVAHTMRAWPHVALAVHQLRTSSGAAGERTIRS